MSAKPMATPRAPLSIVIMAGGTGGHVFPALAVAEKLRQHGVKLNWLGTARGIEAELVPAAGIPLHCLTIEGIRGKGLAARLKAPWLLLRATWQARRLLRKLRADAVLGLGGFASGPGGIAAWTLGIPLLVHEQNAVAGTTNRWLSKVARQVLEAFPGSLPDAEHVGNPVRESIARVAPLSLSEQQSLKLLVLGGSLGALALNELLPQALAQLPVAERPLVRHQTGKRHLANARSAYEAAAVEAEVVDFIEDMAAAYEWADLVICRAGALTVSELTLAGRGSLLVPFPYAIDDHQTRNALWLADNEAGVMKQQSELTAPWLAEFIRRMDDNREQLRAMGLKARALAMPEAAEEVAEFCERAALNHKKRGWQ